jgi:DHA1 family bicyclomycin/chloramphenicol resistance-like MFS transporter
MELFKVTEKQYGWIFAIVAMSLIGASQLNSLVLRKYKSEQIVKVALFCQSIIGIILAASMYNGFGTVYSTVILISMFLGAQGFTFPNSSALSMAPFAKNAGTASALMGGIQMGVGAFTSALVSVLNNGTALPMTGVMAACAFTAFLISVIGSKMIGYKASVKDVEEETTEMAALS